MLLPVGEQTTAEVRAAARRLGLAVVAEKVESQDICFVPDGDHTGVIRRTLGADAPSLRPGPFVALDGRVVGSHDGHARYTVGQRRGLPGGFAEPMFVVAIRPADRAVVIGPREARLGRGVVVREVNWLGPAPEVGAEVAVQVRHRARPVPATVVRRDPDEVEVALGEPVAAITPGQSLVLYEAAAGPSGGTRVLGGGVIEAAVGQPGAPRAALPVLAA